jgi:RNA polymerase sigma-70 factor (ECF subfamily)
MDAELVDRLRAGDEAAFAALVRQYHGPLLRLAEALVGSRAVAEEAVQDTWLAVVRGVDRFEGRSSLKTWLFHILANRARSAGGREARTGGFHEALEDDDRFDAGGAWVTPPEPWDERIEARLDAATLAGRVRDLLGELPAAQRQVVLLRDVEGLPAPDVASLVGITDGHQRVLLHRGRTRLRALLHAELGVGGA